MQFRSDIESAVGMIEIRALLVIKEFLEMVYPCGNFIYSSLFFCSESHDPILLIMFQNSFESFDSRSRSMLVIESHITLLSLFKTLFVFILITCELLDSMLIKRFYFGVLVLQCLVYF